ncbi:hypothetical protein BHE74_00003681 [Ensete ventricosum]|nr:hypothetical protein BHE74_00003681 [Ensete ventricosum]RZR81417.1 hypothetical protein BHM03_00007639 [Ensete ventricosum]
MTTFLAAFSTSAPEGMVYISLSNERIRMPWQNTWASTPSIHTLCWGVSETHLTISGLSLGNSGSPAISQASRARQVPGLDPVEIPHGPGVGDPLLLSVTPLTQAGFGFGFGAGASESPNFFNLFRRGLTSTDSSFLTVG